MWRKRQKNKREKPKAYLASFITDYFPISLSAFTYNYVQEQDRGNSLSYQWAYAVAFWQFQLVAWNWPQTPATVWKPPFTTPQAATQSTIKHNRCKTTALLKRNTATCRREIYQLLLSVFFFRRSKLFISTQPGPVTFPQLLTYTAPWVYYKTIPLEQPGVKCFVQGQGGNNFSWGSNHQTFPNHISHHHQNTILPEEKTDQWHMICLGVQRWNGLITAYANAYGNIICMHAKGESTFPACTVNDYSVY